MATTQLQPRHIEAIKEHFPDDLKSNTKLCWRIWTLALSKLGVEMPEEMLGVMMRFKPESITRLRRELYPPTDDQLKKEATMRNENKFYDIYEEMVKDKQPEQTNLL